MKKVVAIFAIINLLLKIGLAISLYVNFRVENKKVKILKDVNHRKTIGGRLNLPINIINTRSTTAEIDSKKRMSVGNFFQSKNALTKKFFNDF